MLISFIIANFIREFERLFLPNNHLSPNNWMTNKSRPLKDNGIEKVGVEVFSILM